MQAARQPRATGIVIALAALSLAAVGASAAEIRLTLANDPISGNEKKDDLYTSELSLEVQYSDRRLLFSERMFTNREEGIRFDETELGVAFAPLTMGPWTAQPEFGLLRVGEGLFGESVQNRVHRATGSRPVSLEYVDGNSYYPTAAVTFDRELLDHGPLPLRLDVEAWLAPGFRSYTTLRVGATRKLHGNFSLELGAGVRADYVEYDELEPVVSPIAPTGDITLVWRGVVLSYEHNHYGTRSNHVTLGWRAGF